MPSLRQGNIVFAPFPHEDDRQVFDKRPCLVLAVDEEKDRFLAAKITTTELRRYWAFRLSPGTRDTISGRILKESWINLNRREWIAASDCLRILAMLRPSVMNAVLERMDMLKA